MVGTTELAIAHSLIGMSSRPLDTGALGRIAAALLREVPKGTGATSWEPSDEEWEAFRDLTGVDGTGRQAPDLPVPPGATTDKWFCSPIEDTPDSAACIQEIDADQVSSYCSQLRSLGVRSNPELAADLEGEIGCEGTFGPWWVIVSRQGATPFWMATAMRAPGLLD